MIRLSVQHLELPTMSEADAVVAHDLLVIANVDSL